jgi:prevent-host-death family protein
MMIVNVKEARSNLSRLLDKVSRGEEVVVTRHGKKIGCLVPPENVGRLPSLKKFRDSIELTGKPMSRTVIEARDEGRF